MPVLSSGGEGARAGDRMRSFYQRGPTAQSWLFKVWKQALKTDAEPGGAGAQGGRRDHGTGTAGTRRQGPVLPSSHMASLRRGGGCAPGPDTGQDENRHGQKGPGDPGDKLSVKIKLLTDRMTSIYT